MSADGGDGNVYAGARRHVNTHGTYVDRASENVRVEDFNDDGFVSKKEVEGHDKIHAEAARAELLAYIESARRDVAGRFAVFIDPFCDHYGPHLDDAAHWMAHGGGHIADSYECRTRHEDLRATYRQLEERERAVGEFRQRLGETSWDAPGGQSRAAQESLYPLYSDVQQAAPPPVNRTTKPRAGYRIQV